jgi:hypothetical protein
MTSKKKSPTIPSTSQQTLKIGSRVRCTDDGVEGRIVWANAVSLKIRWDDGEQVTWRRDSLADRPIEIVEESEDQSPSAMDSTISEQTEQIESPLAVPEDATTTPVAEASPLHPAPSAVEPSDQHIATDPAPIEQHSQSPTEPTESSLAIVPEIPLAEDSTVENTALPQPTQEEQGPSESIEQQPKATAATAKRPRQRNSQQDAEGGKEKKLSALDAAAKVLAETGTAMTCQELIAAMASKGYWASPGGKTPQATLYSAIIREIAVKGANSRFQKTDRGKFSRNDAV